MILLGLLLASLLKAQATPPPRPALPRPESRTLVVGIDRDDQPYEYLNADGQPAGYDVDLVRALAAVEGLQVAFRADSWARIRARFEAGEIDVLPGMLYSKDREAYAAFSTPHLVVHYTVFVRMGETRIQSQADLAGRRVLVQQGSQMQDFLSARDRFAQLITVASEPEALKELAAGRGDAAVITKIQGAILAQRLGLAVAPIRDILITRQLCLGVQKSRPDLVARLDTALAILNQTGMYSEIYKRWFGVPQPDPRAGQAIVRQGLVILALVLLALVVTGLWNWSLRRQVARATDLLHTANHEIHEREAYLHSVIENLPVAIFGKDPRKGYQFSLWNAHSEAIFGLTKAEILGKSDYDFFPKEQSDHFRAKDVEVVTKGQILDIPEERVLSRSLGEILLHTRKVPLFDESGQPVLLLGISENITEQKAMEQTLRQSQKLESLGILAGGIAHDFNNLLTAILGNLELATLHAAEGDPVHPFLNNAKTTSLRAAELTRQMLAYSGKGLFVVMPLDLSAVAEEMASLLKVSISKQVNLRFHLAKGLPAIQADPAQIQQVVMNLITNASEAIGAAQGEILMTTEAVLLSQAEVATLHPGSPIPPGRYVVLGVKDTGSGMSSEVMGRIFDPFYTTKFSGRGLGLSAMLGILRAHHAGIGIQSQPGAGAEFRIYFPAGDAPVDAEVPLPPAQAFAQEKGTVLLVDDEAEVRQSVGALLRQAGFQVLEAADGVEACEIYRQGHPDIQAVLMDLTMPRMDGRTAAAEILAFHPAAKIILTSGFPAGTDGPGAGDLRLAGFLQKPYEMARLLKEFQRILDDR